MLLRPADLGFEAIGHFGLFHSRHCEGFWRDSVLWLRDGIHPWTAQAALQKTSYSTKNRFLTFTS